MNPYARTQPGSQCDETCTTDCGHCKGATRTRKAAPSDWATADVDRRLAAIKATRPDRPRFRERVDPTPIRRRVRWDRILTLAAVALLAGSAAWAAIYQVTLAVASSSICTP